MGHPSRRARFHSPDGELWGYGEGGRLCRLNLRTGELTVLLDDPQGGIRDPQVHYDGEKILFSYRPGGTHVFHLYEINADSRSSTGTASSATTPNGSKAGPISPATGPPAIR